MLGWEHRSDEEYLKGTGLVLGKIEEASLIVAYGPDTINGSRTRFMRSGELKPCPSRVELYLIGTDFADA